MIHAVIIDDEVNGVRSLELLLTRFMEGIKVVASTTDARAGVDIINNYRPDVVFLDINMPALNGFELLEKIEFRNFHLVFSTAYEEFALKALKLRATDYLLKPIDIEELKRTIERIRGLMNRRSALPDMYTTLTQIAEIRNLRIPLHSKSNIELISPEQILYIEADSNNSTVTLLSGHRERVYMALKEYETLLCREGLSFMRIHNSFIINLLYVSRYLKEDGGYVVMQGKKTIPVSKGRKDEFLKYIGLASDPH